MTDVNICVLGDGFGYGAGDESGQGWFVPLKNKTIARLGRVNFYQLCIPGETSINIAERLCELKPRKPLGHDNRLLLSLGLEDTRLMNGKPLVSNAESVEALKEILVQTRPHFKMLMVGPPPVYDPQRNMRIKRLNSLYRELCSKARVPYIELFSGLSEDVQYKRELIKSDKVFPTQVGYVKAFDLIWNDRSWWFNN